MWQALRCHLAKRVVMVVVVMLLLVVVKVLRGVCDCRRMGY